jgi:hypothetical protein
MGRELLIGLDVGTTRACALVVDGTGSVRSGRRTAATFSMNASASSTVMSSTSAIVRPL